MKQYKIRVPLEGHVTVYVSALNSEDILEDIDQVAVEVLKENGPCDISINECGEYKIEVIG